MRRPSVPTAISLVALFVALGGPAKAARLINGREIARGTIRSAQIRDHSLATRDLSRSAVRFLRSTPDASVTEAKIANEAVTTAKLGASAVTGAKLAAGAVGTLALAPGAVTAPKLAGGSVGGDQVADGSLSTDDVARFSGRFRVPGIPTIPGGSCWSGQVQPQEIPDNADISQDLVLVTPGSSFDEKRLVFSYRNSSEPAHFVLALCNVTGGAFAPGDIAFRYAVLRIL